MVCLAAFHPGVPLRLLEEESGEISGVNHVETLMHFGRPTDFNKLKINII